MQIVVKLLEPFRDSFPRATAAIENRLALMRKAMSFALIGVVNTLVDAGVFFVGYSFVTARPEVLSAIAASADACGCAAPDNLRLVVVNIMSWSIAVSGSYAMNSFITFAAESGRRLSWRAYGTFVASSIVGAVANTCALVLIAQVMPVWFAKGCAILVSFLVNFSMSHFIVFRRRVEPTPEG